MSARGCPLGVNAGVVNFEQRGWDDYGYSGTLWPGGDWMRTVPEDSMETFPGSCSPERCARFSKFSMQYGWWK